MQAPVSNGKDSIVRLQVVATFERLGGNTGVVSFENMAGARWTSKGVLKDQYGSWSSCQVPGTFEYGKKTLMARNEMKLSVQNSNTDRNIRSILLTAINTISQNDPHASLLLLNFIGKLVLT